jgi:hypothetical protein
VSIRLRIDRGPVAGFGDRLALAERLIRAGARAAVVREALEARGTLRLLVTRLHRAHRRPDRPRGPLPSDLAELLATRAMRLEASAFLAQWDRLRAAGRDCALALAEAWEATRALFERRPHARRFTIDHAWVLARGRSQLAPRRCTRCVALWYECRGRSADRPRSEAAMDAGGAILPQAPPRPAACPTRHAIADPRCPHCHPSIAPSRAARSRAARIPSSARSARTAASRPSDELAALADRFKLAEALILAGARLPVVSHLTTLRGAGILRQLYVEVAGERPRQGALPQLGAHVLATSRLRLEASVLVVTASRLLEAGSPAPQALLGAWHIYRALFGEVASFDINAASLVVRARRHPDFHLVTCPRCRTDQIELRTDLRHRRCPVCRSLQIANRRASSPEPLPPRDSFPRHIGRA